jgi:hypothetical protein
MTDLAVELANNVHVHATASSDASRPRRHAMHPVHLIAAALEYDPVAVICAEAELGLPQEIDDRPRLVTSDIRSLS